MSKSLRELDYSGPRAQCFRRERARNRIIFKNSCAGIAQKWLQKYEKKYIPLPGPTKEQVRMRHRGHRSFHTLLAVFARVKVVTT